MGYDLAQIQVLVQRFVRKNGLNEDIPCRVLDLASEVGELAKEVLKGSRYGKCAFVTRPEFEEELGDVLFEVICVANAENIELEGVLHKTLQKMKRRIEKNGHPGSEK